MVDSPSFNGVALSSAALSGLLMLSSAAAQELLLEEVTVTAQRTESTLQKTPVSVSAYSGETLAQKGTLNLQDLGTYTPNLVVAGRAGAGSTQASFAIRGMGVGAQDSTAAVGVYVDEVFFPSAYGNVLGLMDVERIEVLRGPQGTLFGRNTIAGAVQYVTVKPKAEFGAYAELTLGNLDRRIVRGAVNLPLGDILAVRLAGVHDELGGFVTDDLRGKQIGGADTNSGRLQVRLTPTQDLTIDLKAEATRQGTDGRPVAVIGVNRNAQFYGQATQRGETRPLDGTYISQRNYHIAGFNAPDYLNSKLQALSSNIRYQLTDNVTLKSISAYQRNKNHLLQDSDLTPLFISAADRGVFTDNVFTQELQASGSAFTNRLKWTAGGYYYDGNQLVRGTYSITGRTAAPVFSSDTRSATKALAGYAQASYYVTDRWSATLGVRQSHEEIENSDLTLKRVFTNSYDDTSPHIGVNFEWTDTAMLYAKASKGFRAGGLTINANLPGGFIGFDPETAWTYEAGARLEFLDRRLRVNPTVFYTDWQDIQFNYRLSLLPPPPQPVVATQNAGDAILKGGELEVQFAATNKLLLTGSLSGLSSHYTRVPIILLNTFPQGFFLPTGNPVVQVINLDKNQPLQQAPKWKYSLGGRYTQPLNTGAQLIGSLDWGWTAQMRSVVANANAVTLPSYGVLNGRLQYQSPGDRWSVALYSTNLLDKYYFNGGNNFGKSFSIGVDEGDLGRPREYGVTLRANF